jgi:hypothetical protein
MYSEGGFGNGETNLMKVPLVKTEENIKEVQRAEMDYRDIGSAGGCSRYILGIG